MQVGLAVLLTREQALALSVLTVRDQGLVLGRMEAMEPRFLHRYQTALLVLLFSFQRLQLYLATSTW